MNPVFAVLLQSTPSNTLVGLLPILLMFGVVYLLLILPMQRQRKQSQKMLEGLKNGDVVTTSGGIVGSIVAINADGTLVIRVKPDNLKIQVLKTAVSGLVETETK